MGINLIAYELGEKVQDNDYGRPFSYHKAREIEEFDGLRYSGDREFVCTQEFEWKVLVDDEHNLRDSYFYYRPCHIDEAIRWIEINIDKRNQKRLINLMEIMRGNKNVYIYVST